MAWASSKPSTRMERTNQPFQIVSQPGSPSDLRARKPPKRATPRRKSRLVVRLILGFGVLDPVSGDQGADQRAEESLASFTRVMDELKEPEIEGEFLLRNAAMRPKPGAKQGPATFHGVDVDLVEAVTVLVARIFAAAVTDGLVLIAPHRQTSVNAVLVGVDHRAFDNPGFNDRLDRFLLYIGQHPENNL